MQELTFEQALNELESIVKLMEDGNLELDDTLKMFEKGIVLSRICSDKLKKAEKKISVLMANENGEMVLQPATIPEEQEV
ncbi:MAG: exodeoxyribonuclease VII small subunit [Firmicutes bacterium HGW-Firmicutes-14]|nr:MAG: exodeoxyribonuclease VII small subunit [Firmicutes bacterium HGW-Firmicutes-14]